MEKKEKKSEYEIMQDVIIEWLTKENEELWKKYQIVLTRLNNVPEMQRQTEEMIRFHNHMMSHERVVWPILWLIAWAIISLLCFYLF